jgi:hypothetical protein
MQVFIVEYTNEELTGNQCLTMQIEAPNLETAYELVNEHYPELCIDTIYPDSEDSEWDGQPDEAQEWADFDPDC